MFSFAELNFLLLIFGEQVSTLPPHDDNSMANLGGVGARREENKKLVHG
jgi:hypothetical protein